MTIIALSPSTVRWTAGLWLAMSVALLSGCTGSSSAQGPVVTLTVTPTVTATGAPAPATGTATATRAGAPKSDVVGRTFDLGTVVKVVQDGDVPVIIFDRWTARGVPDSKLATNGLSMTPHSDAPYTNLNSRTTFRIPVADGAIFTYNHCVAVDQPAQQRSSTLQEFTALQDQEKIILLTLDPQGRAFKAQNDPAC